MGTAFLKSDIYHLLYNHNHLYCALAMLYNLLSHLFLLQNTL